jgi:hypothetical protein
VKLLVSFGFTVLAVLACLAFLGIVLYVVPLAMLAPTSIKVFSLCAFVFLIVWAIVHNTLMP